MAAHHTPQRCDWCHGFIVPRPAPVTPRATNLITLDGDVWLDAWATYEAALRQGYTDVYLTGCLPGGPSAVHCTRPGPTVVDEAMAYCESKLPRLGRRRRA